MKNLPISNEELISTLKTRLGQKSKPPIHNDDIYREYLKLCHTNMVKATSQVSLAGQGVVRHLRTLADLCSKIESPVGAKEVKRIPILNQIITSIQFLDRGLASMPFHPDSIKPPAKGGLQAARSLAFQARGYCKIAFDFDTFDDASTKLLDASDVLELAQDIYKGDMVSAAKHSDFDTIIREDISDKAWSWILSHVRDYR